MIRTATAALLVTLGAASMALAQTDAELVEAEAFFGNTLAIFDVIMASSARAAQNLGALLASLPAFPDACLHQF